MLSSSSTSQTQYKPHSLSDWKFSFTNYFSGRCHGLAIAAWKNFSSGTYEGLLLAPYNTGKKTKGLVVGGVNSVTGKQRGIVLSAANIVSNVDGGDETNKQQGIFASFNNYCAGLQEGVFASAMNEAGGEQRGIFAAVLNSAKEGFKGLQLGLFNYGGVDSQGLQVGLVNVRRKEGGSLSIVPFFAFRRLSIDDLVSDSSEID